MMSPYIPVVVPGRVDDMLLERVGEGLQAVVGEAGADLAERLELLGVRLVAGQQEAAVQPRALAAAQVRADHHHVQRVAHALQVVFFELVTIYSRVIHRFNGWAKVLPGSAR